jgi:two-component system CheB/CheR fusion protein
MPSKKAGPSASFPIVAAGASAGGLEAFTALLKGLPPNPGMGFVFIQHLEPTHESALSQILSKVTRMPVVEVSEGVDVKPDNVYVIPPNKSMTIGKGTLRLGQRQKGNTPHHPIDEFCFALAEDRKESAIGVLLSGSGSDGTLGLKAIKAAGGITFAQDPKSAQWQVMPESAISAGAVDFVMTPRRIAAELARIGHGEPPGTREPAVDGAELDKICLLLRAATGVDFRLYKQATVTRRVARRMTLHKAGSLGKYAEILRHDPAEAQALADDIFIHVTSFFRDPECFQSLRKQVFSKWALKPPANPIRIWVPGCSTGEEVYSLAMLLIESLGENAGGIKIQMFGTDISERAIEAARAGNYTEAAVTGISSQRLRRFFVKDRQSWQINKPVRDLCVFARHDLAKDPPFSNLDLVSCRNVLIYMGPALQRRTLSVFQYALKPGGFLLLGNSEAISAYSDVFAVKDRTHRIFTRKPATPLGHRFDSIIGNWRDRIETAPENAVRKPAFDFHREAERVLLQRYVPPSVIVDSDLHIVHFQGDTSPYLSPASGQPSFHLLKMLSPNLIVDLRSLISRARREGVTVRSDALQHTHNGRESTLCLEIVPLKNAQPAKYDFLVIFKEAAPAVPTPEAAKTTSSASRKTKGMERELASTRDYLRSLIAEHETAQEEMKAANEEILSANEELQSTNEELETAKEELQSSNEELVSLNEELQHRNSELAQLGNDLTNVLAGVDIPVLVLDSNLRIRRFTPLAEKLFNLIGADVGRPFSQIASNLDITDWAPLFAQVTDKLKIVEREVRDQNGHWYLLRMRPYKTTERRIEGVLLALLDIDSLKKNFEQLQETRNYAESIVETIHESLLVLDGDLRVQTANRTFYRTFRVSPVETLGQLLFELGDHQWDIPDLRKLLEEVLPRDTHFDGFLVKHKFPQIGLRRMLINARQIHLDGQGADMILLAIEDVTTENRA